MCVCLACRSAGGQDVKTPIKNVLFIIADELRASVLGCYDDRFCQTPNIDALARRRLLFNCADCQGHGFGTRPTIESGRPRPVNGIARVTVGENHW